MAPLRSEWISTSSTKASMAPTVPNRILSKGEVWMVKTQLHLQRVKGPPSEEATSAYEDRPYSRESLLSIHDQGFLPTHLIRRTALQFRAHVQGCLWMAPCHFEASILQFIFHHPSRNLSPNRRRNRTRYQRRSAHHHHLQALVRTWLPRPPLPAQRLRKQTLAFQSLCLLVLCALS